MSVRDLKVATSLEEGQALVDQGYVPMAGGTDLVPRIRHGLLEGACLVAVGHLPELRTWENRDGLLTVGAGTTLATLTRCTVPWLADACRQVASPRVRALATLGGAVLQAPRCSFLNRPPLWRATFGPCLSTGGRACWAGGERCVAQQRSLLGTLLVAVGAQVQFWGRQAQAVEALLPLARFSASRGLVISFSIPLPDAVAVESVRRRGSIDYHDVVVVAARRGSTLRCALGAALPHPVVVPGAEVLSPAQLASAVADLIPRGQPGRLSPTYLRHAATVLIGRALHRVWA